VSLYQPKGSPYWHYDFQYKGRRYYGSSGCTKKTAAKEVEKREREKAALPAQGKPPITVDEAAGLYTEKVELAPSWPTIKPILLALVKGLGKAKLLSEITQRDLQVYFAKRRAGRENSSVNREIENARAMWRHAAGSKFDVGDMPTWKSLMLKVVSKPPRELDAEVEEAALFEHLREDVQDAVRFLLLSGWRRGEVLGLRWSDVKFPTKTASTKIKGGDTVIRPLTTQMVEILAKQPQVGPFVFTYVCQRPAPARKDRPGRQKGQRYPLTATALRKPFAHAKAEGGIEDFRIHDLRHTRGTRIVRATGSLAAAKEALKHRNLKTTLRYAHVLDEDVRNALEASESRNIPELPKKQDKKIA
jgi:integrase